MYIWQRLAYPHRRHNISSVRSFASRGWGHSSNNTAPGSAAAVDGLPKSTSGIVASPSTKPGSAARSRKTNHQHADLSRASLQIDKNSKAQIQKCRAKDEFRKGAVVSQVRTERHDIVGKNEPRKTGALKKQSRKTGALDTIQGRKHDIVEKKQSEKTGALDKKKSRRTGVLDTIQARKHDIVGKKQFRKTGALDTIRAQKHDVVKDQSRKADVLDSIRARKHDVVKDQSPKIDAVDKVQIRKLRVGNLRPGKAERKKRKIDALSTIRVRMKDVVGKDQSRKIDAVDKVQIQMLRVGNLSSGKAERKKRKIDTLDTIRVRKKDVVGKDQSRKTDAVANVQIRKLRVVNFRRGKAERKIGALDTIRIRKLNVVGKDQFRKYKVSFRKHRLVNSRRGTAERKIGALDTIRVRKHDVVGKAHIRKYKVAFRKHRHVGFRPSRSEVASAASIKTMVEDESLKKAHLLDDTRIASASHCATARNFDHTLQPRTALTPDDGYLQRSPISYDVPPDGKSSQIEVSPDASEASLPLIANAPMGDVSSRRSGAAPFMNYWKRIRRRRAKRATMREKEVASKKGIIGTDTVRSCTGPSHEEGNLECTVQELSSVSSSEVLAPASSREQVSSVFSSPDLTGGTGWGGIVSMRRKRRKMSTNVVRRKRKSLLRTVLYPAPLFFRKQIGLSSFERAQRNPLLRKVKYPSECLFRTKFLYSSLEWARRSKIGSPSPDLQAREIRQDEITHAGINGIEPFITKYIFRDGKEVKQDVSTEKVSTGLDDLLYTHKELQLRKPKKNTRDNAVEWPSRNKFTRWQRVDTTGQPLGETHEEHCAAEIAESDIQTIVKPQVLTFGGKLDIENTTEIGYQPEAVRPEETFSDDHVARESVESDHQAAVYLPRVRLAYDLDDPLHLGSRIMGNDGAHV